MDDRKDRVPLLTQSAVITIIGDGSALKWSIGIACAGLSTGLLTAGRRFFAFKESRMVETLLRERIHDHVLGLHRVSRQRSDRSVDEPHRPTSPGADVRRDDSSHALARRTYFGCDRGTHFARPTSRSRGPVAVAVCQRHRQLFSNAIHPAVLAVRGRASPVVDGG